VSDPADLDRVRRTYALDGRIILYVGTVEPRKNLVTLIDAFARRRHAGDLSHRLVCVGPYGWLSRDIQSRIERLNVADAITFTDYVPFADLPALYTLAEFFVFPSVYEGFGLPVVEAMACGLPVITGPTSSLREIAGGAIVHVDPLDADSLGAAMVALAANRERREHLSECGIARARLYSWRRAARETLEVYRKAARQAAGAGVASRESAVPPFADVAVKPATPAQAAVGEPRLPWVP
jgi:glycosyltransferase involved in cell wall biosynthesis